MRFVLASQSPARLQVLRTAGIDPVVRVSGVDEDAVHASLENPTPEHVVTALAAAKAAAVVDWVAENHPDAVIVGCDSMLLMAGGEIVGKPKSLAVARERWLSMAGGTGDLLTGHAVIRIENGAVVGEAAEHKSTTVRFSKITEAELDAYLATEESLHVAGGFTLDGFGGWFVDGIDGDHGSVIGISLPLTRRLLSAVGVAVSTLWNRG
ncbi:septum formation inhibitor Maf [Pseudonocardiaceae bacterium YIM PH 21723]|nr:septum formation inhibitor Maf [Pseudonocardiaceae bacterium YIM PH 21723]